jgi:hypothetical protein
MKRCRAKQKRETKSDGILDIFSPQPYLKTSSSLTLNLFFLFQLCYFIIVQATSFSEEREKDKVFLLFFFCRSLPSIRESIYVKRGNLQYNDDDRIW